MQYLKSLPVQGSAVSHSADTALVWIVLLSVIFLNAKIINIRISAPGLMDLQTRTLKKAFLTISFMCEIDFWLLCFAHSRLAEAPDFSVNKLMVYTG